MVNEEISLDPTAAKASSELIEVWADVVVALPLEGVITV
jgi:hypothetical protein